MLNTVSEFKLPFKNTNSENYLVIVLLNGAKPVHQGAKWLTGFFMGKYQGAFSAF